MTTWIAVAVLALASAQAPPTTPASAPPVAVPATSAAGATEGARAIDALRAALAEPALKGVDLSKGQGLAALANAPFAQVALTKAESEQARAALWEAYANSARAACQAELDAGAITVNGITMKVAAKTFGTAPAGRGRNLWISMHGGGGAPAEVNDKQWQNQQRLYTPDEGIYVAPRAPTDTWDLWHQGHIDALFARLIQNMVIAQGVDANRVYLMGYSAGGDGVFQLAPRMADELAAASMMAGHPNESKPDGLRNIGFTLHAGEKDEAFNRNKVAAEWGVRLEELQKEDPNGYPHWVKIHKGKGHWMDREDAEALKWMERFTRNLRPRRVVWLQDDVTHKRFYWLAVEAPAAGERIDVRREGQKIIFTQCTASSPVHLRLDDQMCDLDKQITVTKGNELIFEGIPKRTIGMLVRTLAERGDPDGMFPAEFVLPQLLPQGSDTMSSMRNTLAGLAVVACFAGALAFSPAQDKDRKPLPPGVKPEPTPAAIAFDQMKALAGSWEGTINGDANQKTTVSYRVIANGSAVIETLFAGQPVEMETIFHLDGARLLATHYCAGGNQPRLNAAKIEPKTISFEMLDATNLPDKKLPHMGALRIDFVDADHIKTNWSSFADGKLAETAVFDLTRAKAPAATPPATTTPGTGK